MSELFWLNDRQWAVLEPLLPRLGGKPRVDDRRVISGILHRFGEGPRWRAVPAEYGPRTTLFNRSTAGAGAGFVSHHAGRLSRCTKFRSGSHSADAELKALN